MTKKIASNKARKASTLVFDTLFLNATAREIPEMFQITHRQNHAVKTQTGEGLPVPVTRSEGSRARSAMYCSQSSHLFPPTPAWGLLTHSPVQHLFLFIFLNAFIIKLNTDVTLYKSDPLE